MVTERVFIMMCMTGAVTCAVLIAWMLWEPRVRRGASSLLRRTSGRSRELL